MTALLSQELKLLKELLHQQSLNKQPQKKKKNKRKRNKSKKTGGKVFSSSDRHDVPGAVHPQVAAGDPIHTSIAAQLQPFSVPQGIAKRMDAAQNSQSLSAEGKTVISLAANSTLLAFVAPTATNNFASIVYYVFPNSDVASKLRQSTVYPANTYLTYVVTSTPYSHTALRNNGGTKMRLVGAGLRVRNTSPMMYRGGQLSYIHDYSGATSDTINLNSTLSEVVSKVKSSVHTVTKNFSDTGTVELVYPSGRIDDHWDQPNDSNVDGFWDHSKDFHFSGSNADTDGGGNVAGGTSSTVLGSSTNNTVFSSSPGIFVVLSNSSSNPQEIAMQIVEHTEVAGDSYNTLSTHGIPHKAAQTAIASLHSILSTHHAKDPDASFGSMFRRAAKSAALKASMRVAPEVASIAAVAL